MFSTAQILILFAAVMGSGSMVGMTMWILGRLRQPDAPLDGLLGETGRLEQLRDQLDAIDRDVARLKERADFTDQLLIGGQGVARMSGER